MPILKRLIVPPPDERLPVEERIPMPRRIPGALVAQTETPPEEDCFGHRRIFRKDEARMLVQAFELPVLDFEPAFPLPEVREAPPPPPPEPEPDVEAVKAALEAEWQARLDEAVAAARDEGLAEGRAEAEAALRAEVDAARDAFAEAADKLQQAWEQYMAKTEPLLSHLAFTMAQAILDAPLSHDVKELSARALSQAVDRLAHTPPLQISIHPVDLLRLRETGIVDQLEGAYESLRWDPNEDLKEGDWVVQSPVAMVRHLKEELLHTLRERLTLPRLDDDPTS